MKTIIKSTAVLMAMMLLAGCETFLDTESYTDRNTGNFPGSETDAIQLVTGIYSTMNAVVQEPGTSYWMTAMLASDECYGGGGMDDSDVQAADHLLVTEENVHGVLWEQYNSGIARANMAIANLDKVENADMRNQLLGEAYFMRSYFLFELAQLFGEIPLISQVPTNVEEASEYPAQAPIENIYGTIAAGLKKAIEIMPSNKWNACITGIRHATKWDAEAMLARVYLFYTGFYSDKNGTEITTLPLVNLETGELLSEEVAKTYVIEKLKDCIDNSGHDLVKDFRLMWPYMNSATKVDYAYANAIEGTWITDDVNPEAMFSICNSNIGDGFGNKFNQYLGVRKRGDYYSNAFPFSRGYGWCPVNPYVWTKWAEEEPGDIRREASIWDVRTEGNADYTWGNDNQMEETGFWQKKYQTYGAIVNGKFFYEFSSVPEYGGFGSDLDRGHSPQNIQIIRFADVLLMHSELTQTVDGINRVRQRAGLSPIGSYSFEALEKERRHELAFEAIRWTDMRRYGKAYCIAALKTQLGGTIRNGTGGAEQPMKDQGPGYQARYEATWGFRPFPQSEVSLSNGVLKQNAGWTSADSKYSSWK